MHEPCASPLAGRARRARAGRGKREDTKFSSGISAPSQKPRFPAGPARRSVAPRASPRAHTPRPAPSSRASGLEDQPTPRASSARRAAKVLPHHRRERRGRTSRTRLSRARKVRRSLGAVRGVIVVESTSPTSRLRERRVEARPDVPACRARYQIGPRPLPPSPARPPSPFRPPWSPRVCRQRPDAPPGERVPERHAEQGERESRATREK